MSLPSNIVYIIENISHIRSSYTNRIGKYPFVVQCVHISRKIY